MARLKEILLHNVAFWVLMITAIVMGFISLFLPPAGAISPSVLEFVAELLGFSAIAVVITALEKGTPATVQTGSTTITINKDKEDADNQYIEENNESIDED